MAFQLTKNHFLNLTFALIPASFIAGNLVLNLNILIFLVFTTIFYWKKMFNINFEFVDKLIITFFLFILFTGIYNSVERYLYMNSISITPEQDYTILYKTIFYLRYLLFYFCLRYLINNNLINLKYFFFSCFACSLFVSLDILYQLRFGEDIFGYKGIFVYSASRLSGPFGDELIAGSYIQRFSVIALFFFPFFFQNMGKKKLIIIVVSLFVLYFSTIILSGNRMPLIMFMGLIVLIVIFEKRIRKYLLTLSLLASILFATIYTQNRNIENQISTFFIQANKLSSVLFSEEIDRYQLPDHFAEFESFYDTWLMNKYIGGGVRSFRLNCPHRLNIHPDERKKCNTHPHNYYLEILPDIGLIGLILTLAIFLTTFYKTFVKKYFLRSNLNTNIIITPFIYLFLIEVFPIRSTGSFFTTSNSTYIFLILAILIGLSASKNKIE